MLCGPSENVSTQSFYHFRIFLFSLTNDNSIRVHCIALLTTLDESFRMIDKAPDDIICPLSVDDYRMAGVV